MAGDKEKGSGGNKKRSNVAATGEVRCSASGAGRRPACAVRAGRGRSDRDIYMAAR